MRISSSGVAPLTASGSGVPKPAIKACNVVATSAGGTPGPGQEAEAARFVGQTVTGLTYEAYEPALKQTTRAFFGESARLERVGGPREPFSVRIRTEADGTVEEALARA